MYGYNGQIPIDDFMGLVKKAVDTIKAAGVDEDSEISVSWYESNWDDDSSHKEGRYWTMNISASWPIADPSEQIKGDL
jgi:hypothetical protein